MPKDVMYNDITYDDNTKNMFDSISILEKAKISKATDEYYKSNKKDGEDVWDKIGDFFNPFKCGKWSHQIPCQKRQSTKENILFHIEIFDLQR